MTKIRVFVGVAVLLVFAVVLADVYYAGGAVRSASSCSSCHQIRPSSDRWAESVHRDMRCSECHGSVFSVDAAVHIASLRHVYYQVSGSVPDRILLKDAVVDRLADNCARCHRDKLAQWKAGGHSVKYAQIFLSTSQNQRTRLADDCLRCHGMFVDGGVKTVVAPIDNRGPWRLVSPAFAERSTIPCLTCHTIHSPGAPAVSPDYRAPKAISYGRAVRTTSLGFYDRRERRHIGVSLLPLPAMRSNGRLVKMSADNRQAVCYQCHAPDAQHEVRTGEDRTAIGVHEGIGCLGCHDAHTLDARASCANCHPAYSNCGIDVTKMDTTFKSAKSGHNIHFVACVDCHTKGVPKPRPA